MTAILQIDPAFLRIQIRWVAGKIFGLLLLWDLEAT